MDNWFPPIILAGAPCAKFHMIAYRSWCRCYIIAEATAVANVCFPLLLTDWQHLCECDTCATCLLLHGDTNFETGDGLSLSTEFFRLGIFFYNCLNFDLKSSKERMAISPRVYWLLGYCSKENFWLHLKKSCTGTVGNVSFCRLEQISHAASSETSK